MVPKLSFHQHQHSIREDPFQIILYETFFIIVDKLLLSVQNL